MLQYKPNTYTIMNLKTNKYCRQVAFDIILNKETIIYYNLSNNLLKTVKRNSFQFFQQIYPSLQTNYEESDRNYQTG